MAVGTTEAASPGPASRLIRSPDFVKLWVGQSVSELGSEVSFIAIPLAAILTLHADALQIGFLQAAERLPFVVIGLLAGPVVDRVRRRRLMLGSDVGRALAIASVPAAFALHSLTLAQLFVVVVISGVLTVFFDVAYQSYLPSAVGRAQLVEANSKLVATQSVAQIAGPGLGGLLVGAFRAPIALLADAVSFVVSVVSLTSMRAPEPKRVEAEARGRVRSEIAEGLRWVFGQPVLRRIAACTAISNLFTNMMFAVFLLYAVRRLGLSAGEVGLILALGNLGGVLGALTAGRLTARLGVGRVIAGSAFLFGPPSLLIPLAPRSSPFAWWIAALSFTSFASVVYNVNQVSLRQAITPDRLQGRLHATMRFLVWGTIPLGSVIGGVLGTTIGLHPTLWVGAIGASFSGVFVLGRVIRSIVSVDSLITAAPVSEAGGAGT
jgi:MFS family permease